MERYQCQAGTSTPSYLTNGALDTKATSTCILAIPKTINADLNIYGIASTSASTLNVEIYDSFAQTTLTREWYPHQTYSDSGNTRTWYSKARNNVITMDSTTASSSQHKIPLGTLRAGALKIEYAVASTTNGNAGVYLEVVKENDN